MTRPRAAAVIRRFLDGATLHDLTLWVAENSCSQEWEAMSYIEQCIRRRLNAARKRGKK